MKGFVRDLPLTGSLTVGVGKDIGDTIEMKARELEIPPEDAVDYFFSGCIPEIVVSPRGKKALRIE